MINWLSGHKALLGTILVVVGGYLSGQIDMAAAIAAVLAALSGGLKPTPVPAPVAFDPTRRDAA